MRFTPWATRLALTLSLSATTFLTACGGGGSDGGGNANVRLLNATRSYNSLSLEVADKKINADVAYAGVGEYGSVDINSTTRVLINPVGTSIYAATPTLTAGSDYTYITYGFSGAIRTTVLQETETAPEATKAKLLVLNLAPDAGAVDVYVTAAGDDLATASPLVSNLSAGSGYQQINSGTFRVRVTGVNRRGEDLRLDIPAVTLDSASVNTLLLTSTDGGVLVNGITLVQKGAAKSFPASQSRVRTVAALTAGGTVTSSVNGTPMWTAPATSPLISSYVTTAAGASTLATTINGAPVTFTAPTLVAGKDYTLLVWGSAAAPQMTVLDDDNRLPAVAGNVKIRQVNALPTVTSSLNVDFTSIASNVASGTSSTFANISSSTASQVEVSVSSSATPIFNNNNTTLAFPANSVWTFFSVPTAAGGMTAVPRRER
ncbi:DUF4397 domain-containing protein [Roseateles sp. DC23W]|uniref:DUF4397 domain-containing protein n=1 Tax=Pelomonas dachongensis TaxID=3299029 RepID=A0ABW7EMC8_9BURK